MSRVMIQHDVNFCVTGEEAGREFANAPHDVQIDFLRGAVSASEKFNWPMQCRMIVDDMTREDRMQVAAMLATLVEHLEGG